MPAYAVAFAAGWILDVVELDGAATAWLTSETECFAHDFSDRIPLELPMLGCRPQLVFAPETSAPAVRWERLSQGEPYVWECAAGIAGWLGRMR